MSNKSKSILLLLSKAFSAMVTMGSMMFIARGLSINDYSEYRQVITVVSLIVSIFSIGLPSSILYFLTGKEKEKYLSNIYLGLSILCLILVIFSYPIMLLSNNNFDTKIFTESYSLIAVLIIVSLITSILENLYISYNKIKLILLTSFAPNLIYIILVIYLYWNHSDSNSVVIALIMRELVKVFVFFKFVSKHKMKLKYIKYDKIKEVLFFGIPIGLSSLIGSLNTNIDKLLVGRYLDDQSFAIISNGSYEIPVLSLVGISLFNILIPSLKHKLDLGNNSEVLKLWRRAGEVMITVIIPITIGTIVFAKEIIVFLFSNKYLDAVIIFQIYQINAITRIYIYGTFFLAAGQSKRYTQNSIYHLVNNFLLSLILINFLGVLGVALAAVLSNIIQVFIQNHQISKILKVQMKNVFPYKSLSFAIMICVSLTYLSYFIYMDLTGFNILIGISVMGTTVLLTMLVLNLLINREILDYGIQFYLKLQSKFKLRN